MSGLKNAAENAVYAKRQYEGLANPVSNLV